MEQKMIKDLKLCEFFTLHPVEDPDESKVLMRGAYDRSSKKYECAKYDDVNDTRFYKATKMVWVGFTF